MPAYRVYYTDTGGDQTVHVALNAAKVEEYFKGKGGRDSKQTHIQSREFMKGWRKAIVLDAYNKWKAGDRADNFIYSYGGYSIDVITDKKRKAQDGKMVTVNVPVESEKKVIPIKGRRAGPEYDSHITPETYFNELENIPPLQLQVYDIQRQQLKNKMYRNLIKMSTGEPLNLFTNVPIVMNYIFESAKKYLSNMNRALYKIEFRGSAGEICGTMHVPFTNLYDAIIKKINDMMSEYGDGAEFEIIKIYIYERFTDEINDQKIWGSTITRNKNKHDIIYDMTTRMVILNIDEYISELNRATYICSPNSTKHCMLKCILYGVYNTMDIKRKDTDIIRKAEVAMLEITQTIKDLRTFNKILGDRYFIEVLFIDNGIIKKIEDGKNADKKITLLIKGGHCYYISYDTNFTVDEPNDHDITYQKPIIKKEYKHADELIYTYDMETTSEGDDKTICYAVGIYDGKRSRVWYGSTTKPAIDMFMTQFIDKISKKCIIYAHNGGKFDNKILLNYLLSINKKDMILNYLESGGRILNMDIKNTKGRIIKFRDSYSFISSSLERACADFKTTTKKLVDTVEHDKININNCYTDSPDAVDNKGIMEYTEQYLRNDVQCLYEILMNFNKIIYDTYGFNFYSVLTNAGISKKVYGMKYYNDNLYYLNDIVDSEIRPYYYGGRNEVFNMIGEHKGDDIKYYGDFTSLYPYVMSKGLYGTGEMTVTELTPDTKFNNNWVGLVQCIVRTTHRRNTPYHAVKTKHKLIFAYIDTPTTLILDVDDIKYSLDNDIGYEYIFIKLYGYSKKENLFNGIVTDLFKMKYEAEKKGNEALRTTAKIIANSLYGSWGIKYKDRDMNVIQEHKTDDDFNQYYNGLMNDQKLRSHEKINNYDLYQIKDRMEPYMANLYIAFKICADARTHLYKLMKAVTDKGGLIYYCDTDSIVTNYNIWNDDDISRDFIGTNTGQIGEVTNEIELEVIKKSPDKKIMKEYISTNCTKNNAIGFKEFIVTGNKQYYMGYDDVINGVNIKFDILKCKGINSKNKYNDRDVDEENKRVIYRGISKDGKYKINKTDFIMMGEGYTISTDSMNFKGSFKNNLMKGGGLIKTTAPKDVRQIYDKGVLNGSSITAITI